MTIRPEAAGGVAGLSGEGVYGADAQADGWGASGRWAYTGPAPASNAAVSASTAR
jgi:hypothetical protein